MTSSIFWDITLRIPLRVNRRVGGTCRLHFQGRSVSQARYQREAGSKPVTSLACSSTLKMKATCSSETSVHFQRTTRRYIPEDRTLHNYRCENLKSYNTVTVFEQSPHSRADHKPCHLYYYFKSFMSFEHHYETRGGSRKFLWNVVNFCHFGTPGTQWIGGGPHSRSGRRGEEKILDPTGTRTPIPLSSSP
jgi:hypothetical protein